MRKAILHVGLHKTGTTFLQLSTRRWLAGSPDIAGGIFFSSQHMTDSQWLTFRKAHFQRLRNKIALYVGEAGHLETPSIQTMLAELALEAPFGKLREYFARAPAILFHSDENTLGAACGHMVQRQTRRSSFYPNGARIAATVALAAAAHYDAVELVFSVRRFDEMIVSSLKDAALKNDRIIDIQQFLQPFSNMGAHFERMIEELSGFSAVQKIHVLDFRILRRSQSEYFAVLQKILGEFAAIDIDDRRVNASLNETKTIERLVRQELIEPHMQAWSLRDIVGADLLDRAKCDYDRTAQFLATPSAKVSYYS